MIKALGWQLFYPSCSFSGWHRPSQIFRLVLFVDTFQKINATRNRPFHLVSYLFHSCPPSRIPNPFIRFHNCILELKMQSSTFREPQLYEYSFLECTLVNTSKLHYYTFDMVVVFKQARETTVVPRRKENLHKWCPQWFQNLKVIDKVLRGTHIIFTATWLSELLRGALQWVAKRFHNQKLTTHPGRFLPFMLDARALIMV